MKKLILIKLGGSLITDKNKPETADMTVIKELANEIKEINDEKKYKLIIGHGSGSFAHVPAKQYQTKNGFINEKSPHGMVLVQDAAAKLNRIIVNSFIEEHIEAFSINPSSALVASSGKIIEWYLKPLLILLKNNILPVVYGDTVCDEKLGCTITSTEVLLNYLALNLKEEYKIEKLIYLGITDGVWDENKTTIPLITPETYLVMQKNFGVSHGIDATGGMEHKMSEAIAIAKTGVEVVIANGKVPGTLKKIINVEKVKCTIIHK